MLKKQEDSASGFSGVVTADSSGVITFGGSPPKDYSKKKKALDFWIGKDNFFPKRDAALERFGKYKLIEDHGDGDYTIESNGSLYIVTRDGHIFAPSHIDLKKSNLVLVVEVGGQRIECDVADTHEKQYKGLSEHDLLQKDHGMLFVFPNEGTRIFHTNGMHFPIDIVWMNKDWKVVGIEKDAAPGRVNLVSPDNTQFVMEINPEVIKFEHGLYASAFQKTEFPFLLKAIGSDIKMSVKVIIRNSKGEILILKDKYSDFWDLPGGHIKDGESADNAIDRETSEETGLIIVSKNPLFIHEMTLGKETKPVAFYNAKVADVDSVRLSEEHIGFLWADKKQIQDLNLGVFKDILKNTESYQLEKSIFFKEMSAKDFATLLSIQLSNTLQLELDEYIKKSEDKKDKYEAIREISEVLRKWVSSNRENANIAFAKLFKSGFYAGALAVGNTDNLQLSQAINVLNGDRFRLSHRYNLLGDRIVKSVFDTVGRCCDAENKVDIQKMKEMMQKTIQSSQKEIEAMVKTETTQALNLGRVWAWEQSPERFLYKYYWNTIDDQSTRVIKKMRVAGNPYSFDEIKYLMLHQEQQKDDGEWENGSFNCRCSLDRDWDGEENKADRFEKVRHMFRKTLDITF